VPPTDNRIWRVAVVGCGIGRAHIAGYIAHPDKFQVLVLCDIDEKGLASLGDEFSITRRTKSIDDVLRMEDVDIVDICTPPALHVAQTLAALAAGKEVVCEKPLAGSLAEIDRIITAEARAAGRVMPVFQYRYGDGLQKAKRIIELSIAGKPYLATVETAWRRTPAYYETPWRGRLETELGGVFSDTRDPFARFADLFDGAGRVGVCAHGDAGQSGRGRGLRRRQPRDAQRRSRFARSDARFAPGDQPAAPVL
jgi:predicted dehydrogenase